MESSIKNAGAVTPVKSPQPNRSKISKISKDPENLNPNFRIPSLRYPKSPAAKSASKTQKSAPRDPNPVALPSPRNKIRERKFVVAKRNSKKEKINSAIIDCKCKDKVGYDSSHKCLCVAYETLRASQEEFFKHRGSVEDQDNSEQFTSYETPENGAEEDEPPKNTLVEALEIEDGVEMGKSNVKRRREKLLKEARENGPEAGSGRVLLLVKAFEGLLTMPKSKDADQKDGGESEDIQKEMKWALPGLQRGVLESQAFSSSFCQSDFFLTSESLGLDSRASSSSDSSQGRSRRSSGGGHRSRRNSSESTGTFGGSRRKKRQPRATQPKPFNLQTEQRGRSKQEEFINKVQHMVMEEEKQRIPIAQGLPWTTDEPECLVKPPVKESTRPIDLALHSDARAVERADFDQRVAEKMILIEQYRGDRERQQKLTEEEEIRRLRKELIPKAQPMPYFDRPFIPRRLLKHPTLPRELKFNIPQKKTKHSP
ncbi:hypothetical protein NMG60_11006376 [Bertholletia excelsa]